MGCQADPILYERPWKELLIGMHLGSGVQDQTSAQVVSCPPRGSGCAISPVIFSPCQSLKDVIQIPLFKLLK